MLPDMPLLNERTDEGEVYIGEETYTTLKLPVPQPTNCNCPQRTQLGNTY